MPSDYELSDEECDAIACALRFWVHRRAAYETNLTTPELLELAQKLGGDE